MNAQTAAGTTIEGSNVRGMAIMAFSMFLLPLMDSIAKWLATNEAIAPGQVTFARFLIQLVLTAVIIVSVHGIGGLRAFNMVGNLVRGMLIGCASLLFFTAVKYMPVADAISVFFVEPMILTMLSAVFLKEPIGWRRWLAVVTGFFGALIVIQPSYELFGLISLLPLGTATLFSVYMILNRSLSGRDSAIVMQFVAGVGGTAITGMALVLGMNFGIADLQPGLPINATVFSLLAGLGILATFGHMAVTQAFKYAPASILAPFQYLEIVSAAAVGLIVFGDFPSPSKWLGISIIIGSGLFVFWRESRLKSTVAVDAASGTAVKK
jgi:drug/metabolite transporter (DMT)-like permease